MDVLIDSVTMLPDTISTASLLPGLAASGLTFSLTDYGVPVDVAPPPASEVTDAPFTSGDLTGTSPAP